METSSAAAIHVVGGEICGPLVSALVRAAVEAQIQPVVVDLSPWSGGADVLLGLEHVPGVRWHDISGAAGEFDGVGLVARLPHGPDGERVLAHDRWSPAPIPATVVHAAVEALREAADLLILAGVAPDTVVHLHCAGDLTWVGAGADVRGSAAAVVAGQWLTKQAVDFATVLICDGHPTDSVDQLERIDHVVTISQAERRDVERGVLCGRRRSALRRLAKTTILQLTHRQAVA